MKLMLSAGAVWNMNEEILSAIAISASIQHTEARANSTPVLGGINRILMLIVLSGTVVDTPLPASSSDAEIQAMTGAPVADIELEPLAPLIARNAEHRRELLAAARGALTAQEVGRFLGISRQAVDKRRRSRGLLALRQGRDWRYPRCQFTELPREVVAGLPRLLDGFSEAGPWVILDFLLAPDDTLGGKSPLETMQAEGWTDSLERLTRIENGDGFA